MKNPTETAQVKKSPHKGFRRLVYIAVTIGFFLVGTPFAIKYAITEGLMAVGSKQVNVGDVDFNPFTGVLAVKELEARTTDSPELVIALVSVNVDWLPLLKQRIMLKSLVLNGVQLTVEQGKAQQLKIAGLNMPTSNAEESPKKENESSAWGIGVGHVQFINNRIELKSPDFSSDINIRDLSLKQLFSWAPDQSADLTFETDINKAAISGELELVAFAKNPVFKGKLNIDQFILDDFISLTGGRVNKLKGRLSTDLSVSLSLEESGIHYQQQGNIRLQDSHLGLNDIQLVHQTITWDGDVDFSLNKGQTGVQTKGVLALNKHQNTLTSPSLVSKIESASWTGGVNFKSTNDKSDLKVVGDFIATGLHSKNRQTKLSALQLENLTINGILIDQLDSITLSQIVLDGLTLAQKQVSSQPLLTTTQISLDKVQLNNLADINLEAVSINGLAAEVNIDKHGNLALFDELMSSLKPKRPALKQEKQLATTNNTSAKKPLMRVGGIKVTGNNQIALTTATSSDLVKKKIQIKTLSIGELNNQKPNVSTPIDMVASINKHSKLSLNGQVAPFSQKVNAQVVSTLKSFELPEFSPLIRKQLGYNVHSGQLDSEFDIKIKQNQLNGTINVAIHKLDMEPADPDKVAKMAQQLTMPLDSALSLLRDKNDDIELLIPIKGDIANPDFALGAVINKAMGNALQGTVTNYLKYALQPYGLIYMAAEKAYGVASSISLEAIEFQPSEHSLSGQSKTYMEKIGQLMQKRPGLRIRVCGFATESDRLKLIELNKANEKEVTNKKAETPVNVFHDKLLDLAKERVQVVKSHLISTYQISGDRLFNCLPQIEEQKGAPPRVELLI